MTTPRVTVPGEPTELIRLSSETAEYLLRVAEEADDNQWQDWAATMRQASQQMLGLCAKLSAAPAPEGGAVDGPEDDELPGDFLARVGMDGALWADGFRKMALKLGYSDMDEGWLIGWFCNAVMAGYDHAQRRFDPALATREEAPDWTARTEAAWAENNREEAPADYVSDARQMVEAPAEAGEPEALRMAYKTGYQEGVEDSDGNFCRDACEEGWGQYLETLRAQPQAREEAQPVAVTIFCPECSLPHVDEGEWATTRRHKTHQCQGCGHEWRPFPFATVGVSHPTTPPAPEAEKLRVALRKIAYGDGGIGTHRAIALAALQAEQKGGA